MGVAPETLVLAQYESEHHGHRRDLNQVYQIPPRMQITSRRALQDKAGRDTILGLA